MMTVAEYNREEVIPLLELLAEEKVDTFALERFMPSGQSRGLTAQVLTSAHVREVFAGVMGWADGHAHPRVLQYRPLFCLLAKDDPHVGAMCSVGENALTVLHDGTILPCRRLPIPLGNILRDNLFEVWAESRTLWQVRNPRGLKGKCGHCEYVAQCRGCRAMAYAVTGDWLAPDPHCWHHVDATPTGPRLAGDIHLVWPQQSSIRFAYSLATGTTVELNETSFAAMQLMDGHRTVREVAAEVLPNAEGIEDLAGDIESLCEDLREMGFLVD